MLWSATDETSHSFKPNYNALTIFILVSVYIIRTFYEGSQQRPIAESVLHPLIFVVYFSILIITSLSEVSHYCCYYCCGHIQIIDKNG